MTQLKSKMYIVFITTLVAAAFRLLPHPPNFTPMISIAIIAGLYSSTRWLGLFCTLAAMLISDAIIGFHSHMYVVYFCIGLFSLFTQKTSSNRLRLALLKKSTLYPVIFFIVTNFSVWISGSFYEKSFSGLITCYIAALPFFQNTLVSTLLFSFSMYLCIELATRITFAPARSSSDA